MDYYEALIQARRENKTYATATVVKTEGSTPRSAGSKMLVLADGTAVGTVGGGVVERQAMADCKTAMKTGETMLKTYMAVAPEVVERGMVCGNNMTIFIEPGERRPYLYLCGCGHVAQAVMPLAKSLGFYLVGIDARDVSGFGDALKPLDELIILDDFKDMAKLDFVPGSAYIACSFSHDTDGDVLQVILSRDPAYVGMLGGRPKIRKLFQRLKEYGYSEETLRKINAPIGLDLGGEDPAAIAVSVMAEILMVQNRRTGRPLREDMEKKVFPLE